MANTVNAHGQLVFEHESTKCKAHPSRIGGDVFHNLTAAVVRIGAANERAGFKQFRIAVVDQHFQAAVVVVGWKVSP